MTHCKKCGELLQNREIQCPKCGAATHTDILQPLDTNGDFVQVERRRLEKFPPLFSEEERKKRAMRDAAKVQGKKAPAQKNGSASSSKNEIKSRRRGRLLIACIAVIIGTAAAVAIYLMLPQLKNADETPVLFLSENTVYMIRGSDRDDVCTVYNFGDRLEPVRQQYGDEQALARTLLEKMIFDEESEALFFTDLNGGLYRVRLNRIGFGKKDLSDKVDRLCSDLVSGAEENCMVTSFCVRQGSIYYIRGENRQLHRYTDNKDKAVLAEGVRAFAVSEKGTRVAYLTGNGENGSGSSLYILVTGEEERLVKIDSKVNSVQMLDAEFDRILYTHYEPHAVQGPYSVWEGGLSMDKERVLDGIFDCFGFTEDGFYYAIRADFQLQVADYVEDISTFDSEYASYETLREAIKRSSATRTSQTIGYWQNGNTQILAENVSSWSVADERSGLISMTFYDYEKLEKISIRDLKSAYDARSYVEKGPAEVTRCLCLGTSMRSIDAMSFGAADGQSDRLWLINDEEGRQVLYETAFENTELTKVTSDVYAVGCCDGILYIAKDYNDATSQCDIYSYEEGSIQCLVYDAWLPDRTFSVCEDCGGLACLTKYLPSSGTGTLTLYNGSTAEQIASGVKQMICVSSYRLFYLDEEGAMYAFDGNREQIAENVRGVAAPGLSTGLRLTKVGY